jgi:hypothetical protein
MTREKLPNYPTKTDAIGTEYVEVLVRLNVSEKTLQEYIKDPATGKSFTRTAAAGKIREVIMGRLTDLIFTPTVAAVAVETAAPVKVEVTKQEVPTTPAQVQNPEQVQAVTPQDTAQKVDAILATL